MHSPMHAPGQMLLQTRCNRSLSSVLARQPRHSLNQARLPVGGSYRPGRVFTSSSRRDAEITGVSFASLPISQQSLSMAFQILDRDEDGRISRSEACRLVAYYLALQQHKPAPPQRRPLTWDQHLLASIAAASKLSKHSWAGTAAACEAYVGAKVSGGLQAHPPRCSDLTWGALGMAAAVLALGLLAAAAKALPVVGHWHQQGVPLLLGSFGTLAILLFGKPEAEPVRLWHIIAGQVGATAIVTAVLHVWGPNLISRAVAMAATVAWMMWSDCIHPPGGALVLMAMDNAAIQQMSWAYLLWPSLALSLGVLLPISAAANWLRRNYQFDAPWTEASAATLQQKVREWQQQQAAKQAAVLRQYRALEIDRGFAGHQALHEELHSPAARLARVFAPILQLLSFPKPVPQPKMQRSLGVISAGGQQLQVRGMSLDLGDINLGRSITEAGPAEAAAAAALDAAIRRRLQQEQETRLEDKLQKRWMWGGAAQPPDAEKLEDKINKLHRQRMQQQGLQGNGMQQNQQQQSPSPPQQQQGQEQEPGVQHQEQQQQQPVEGLSSPRQRLEHYWRAELADGRDGSRCSSRSSSPRPQQPRFGNGSSSRRTNSSSQGAMDSFAPDEE